MNWIDICGDDSPEFELEGGNPSGGTFSGNGVNNGFFDPKIAGVGVPQYYLHLYFRTMCCYRC